jgi:ethanolamine ammonia-lyase small subunit
MRDRRPAVPNDRRNPVVDDDAWAVFRQWTAARIGLRRAGASLATEPLLDLMLAHARARDAVHEALDAARLTADLAGLGVEVLSVASAAPDRTVYLMRPDLGRCLASDCAATLAGRRADYDVVFVVADGLSARAVQMHARPVLAATIAALRAEGWLVAPVVIVRHGRVAIGDAVAAALGAACVTVLIGERPGLSAPDSMGAYLTWQPHAATTDAQRNCISNIRPEGIGYEAASLKFVHLLRAMRTLRLSGVALKDDSDRLLIDR